MANFSDQNEAPAIVEALRLLDQRLPGATPGTTPFDFWRHQRLTQLSSITPPLALTHPNSLYADCLRQLSVQSISAPHTNSVFCRADHAQIEEVISLLDTAGWKLISKAPEADGLLLTLLPTGSKGGALHKLTVSSGCMYIAQPIAIGNLFGIYCGRPKAIDALSKSGVCIQSYDNGAIVEIHERDNAVRVIWQSGDSLYLRPNGTALFMDTPTTFSWELDTDGLAWSQGQWGRALLADPAIWFAV